MIVIDREPYGWVLLEEDGRLFLNAYCTQSAANYFFLIELNEEEVSEYRSKGRSYLNGLAHRIHFSAPGVINSCSTFKSRSLLRAPEGDLVLAAMNVRNRDRSRIE